MAEQGADSNLGHLVDFVLNAPADETLIKMDCNDCCEHIARLADQVAKGADLDDILPEMQKFMRYWSDCREEFEALVAVLQREHDLDEFDFSALDGAVQPD